MKLLQNSGVPIYQQIAEQLKTDILAGKLKEGEYLPSIRGLDRELQGTLQALLGMKEG